MKVIADETRIRSQKLLKNSTKTRIGSQHCWKFNQNTNRKSESDRLVYTKNTYWKLCSNRLRNLRICTTPCDEEHLVSGVSFDSNGKASCFLTPNGSIRLSLNIWHKTNLFLALFPSFIEGKWIQNGTYQTC